MRDLSPRRPDESRLGAVIAAIDALNSADPNRFGERPLAQAEGEIASDWLDRLAPDASDEARIAARAHHLHRWAVPRADYPEGRAGYLRWRHHQKQRHARELGAVMAGAGYDPAAARRAGAIVMKQGLATDPEVGLYEDAVALTFLETQFAATAERLGDDRTVEILAKTLDKMTERGRAAASALPLESRLRALLDRASRQRGG